MPSSEAECFLCNKLSNTSNIVGHLMTHKKDLLSYLVKTKDVFATVRQKEVEEGKEAKEYYCCFGCKKQYADKTKMRDHITTSAECIQKHKDFLRDIGFSKDEVDIEINNHLRETNRLLKNENFLLKQQLAEAQTTTVEDIQNDCYKAEQHIRRMEEAFSNLLYFLSEKDRKYIDAFYRSWKCEGVYDNTFIIQHRRKLLSLLKQTPLLQMALFPSWEFLRNNYHPSSGEYITFLSRHFDRHFDYRPGDKIMGNPDERPAIPFPNQDSYVLPPEEEKTLPEEKQEKETHSQPDITNQKEKDIAKLIKEYNPIPSVSATTPFPYVLPQNHPLNKVLDDMSDNEKWALFQSHDELRNQNLWKLKDQPRVKESQSAPQVLQSTKPKRGVKVVSLNPQ